MTDVMEETLTEAPEVAVPIALVDLGANIRPGVGVAKDLLLDGQVVAIVGEEGEGKSTLAWQIACQLAAGEDIGGEFEVEEPVTPVLIVDVEQSEEDAVILRDELDGRGLKTDGVFWLDAAGRSLDLPDDIKWLTAQVRALRPQVLIIDTGTESVTKPRDDDSVKPLFVALNRLLKNDGIRAVVLLGQPRKRAQGEPTGRKFDDFFGSRVWKGRSSAVLFLERERITVWKQRGSYIRRRWGSLVGQYIRSDTEPTRIAPPKTHAETASDRDAAILSAVIAEPGKWSKSPLIKDKLEVPHRDYREWGDRVDALIKDGHLVAEGQYNRLSPTGAAAFALPVSGTDDRD